MKPLDFAKSKLEGWIAGDDQALESPEDQPQNEQDLAKWVRSKLEDRLTSSARLANEATWLTNIAYLCGIDSVEFDSKARQFRAVNLVPKALGKSRVHINKVLPTAQNRKAKLLKSLPRWEVRPKSTDDEDKAAARLGKAIILQDWDQLKINKKRLNLIDWVQSCGHAYLKVCWDVAAGPKEYMGEELVCLGEKRVDVVSPFEGFPDPLATTWEELNDFIHAKVRPLSYFRSQYKEKGHLVKQEDCWVTGLQYEMRINSFTSLGGGQSSTDPTKNTAIEISYYEKPSTKHPRGRHLIVANGVLLKDDILPIDEIPFAKFDDIEVAGKYNSEAMITHIRPMQDQYNRNKTLRAAWINRLVAGKYVSARGANLGAEALNDQSGEVLEYDPVPNAKNSGAPEALQIPQIPQYVYTEDEGLIADINDVSGINQTSRGQLPSASIPALGMQMLIEQDDTRIGIETEQHEYAYADLGRILLKFTSKYYTDERILKELGQGFNYVVHKFKGTDLRDNFDVHVLRGSTLPGSKVLNRQDIKTLHQEGYFGDPQDPSVVHQVFSMLEFGEESEIWKRLTLTNYAIQKGLDQIEKEGIKPVVSEFDNHPMWILKFDNFRLSDAFDRMDDARKALIIEVMEEHLQHQQRIVAPQTMEDEETAPDLKETTAAQEMEQELLADGIPQAVPEDVQTMDEVVQ